MNRILGKKKLPTENDPLSQAKDGKRWRKAKKMPEATKSQVDLSTALPALEDFRTSLIMPNLSARFSMLREQDDPLSKIGKASDDSVLQPRRKSRLHDLDFDFRPPLGDIAENVSPKPARPMLAATQHDSFTSDKPPRPSLSTTQHESFASEEVENDSSAVLNRPRPVEGNSLFGGRQKVYKLANSSYSRANGLGKVTPDPESHMSAFQKHRQREREQATSRPTGESPLPYDDDSSSSHSGPAAYAANHESMISTSEQTTRNTNSSLRSQQSVDSATPSMPSQTRSSSAATSVNSQPTSIPPPPTTMPFAMQKMNSQSGSTERSLTKRRLYEQSLDQHVYEQQTTALTRLNSISRQQNSKSPPANILTHARSIGSLQNRAASTSRPQSPNPLFPPSAFGSMRSPVSGGSTPNSTRPQSPAYPFGDQDDFSVLASTVHPSDRGKATAMGAFNRPKQPFDEAQYLQRLQQLQRAEKSELAHLPPPANDEADAVVKQDGGQGTSSPSQGSERAFEVFQSAASAMRSIQSSPNPNEDSNDFPFANANRTFLKDVSPGEGVHDAVDSPLEQKRDYSPRFASNRFGPPPVQSNSDYSLQRTPPTVFPEIQEEDEEDAEVQAATGMQSESSDVRTIEDKSQNKPPALGGLVHQHLRNTSNVSSLTTLHQRNASSQSSVYNNHTSQEPIPLEDVSQTPRRAYGSDKQTRSNPWDIDDFANNYYNDKTRPVAENASTELVHSSVETKSQHTRDTSTGTIQEREAFANELAARQKAIQEHLRGMTTSAERAPSPQPAASGASKAFSMLRNVSSHEVLPRSEIQPKAMRMLGISHSNASGTQSHYSHADTDNGDGGLAKAQASLASRPSGSAMPSFTKPSVPFLGQRARGDSESSVAGKPSNVRPTFNTPSSNQRSRSSSVAQGRATDGMDSPRTVSARHSPVVQDAINMRDTIRPNANGYFEVHNTAAAATAPSQLLIPPGIKLNTRSASGPSLRGSPVASPISSHTPPMSASASGSTTPIYGPTSTVSSQQPFKPTGSNLKKRNVSKYEISEPTLISSTSNVETVDLPPGASLKNGLTPAPLAPLKPRRQRTMRLFKFGHDGAADADTHESSAAANAKPMPPRLLTVGQYDPNASPVSSLNSTETSPINGSAAHVGRVDRSVSSPATTASSADKTKRSPILGVPPTFSPIMTEEGMF